MGSTRAAVPKILRNAGLHFEFLTANSGSSFVAEAVRVAGRGAVYELVAARRELIGRCAPVPQVVAHELVHGVGD
jgi:hypothetical protein